MKTPASSPPNLLKPLLFLSLATVLLGCEPSEPQLVGTLERDRLRLITEISEPVTEILVYEGEQVTSGQLLLKVDSRRTEARVAEAQAQLSSAEARLRELIRGPRQEAILESQANVEDAEAALRNAEAELQRSARLVTENLVSQAQLDQHRAARDSAQAQLNAANARLEAQLDGTTSEELDQSRATVAAAEAALAQLQILRERLDIRAPLDGRVETLPYRLGEQPPTGTAVVILLADAPVYARVYLPEALRTQISVGDQTEISIAGSTQSLTGRVRFLAGEASYTPFFALTEQDRGRLSYLTEIDILGDTTNLPTGVPVSLRFPLPND